MRTRQILTACLMSFVSSAAFALDAGTYADGYQLGFRNGGLIAERVHKRVIGHQGCYGLEQYQGALNVVTSRVRPPAGRGGKFTAGFYKGYVDAIKISVRETRIKCGQTRFRDGGFPGSFMGNVYCQVGLEDASALAELSFEAIYSGWSANESVRESCLTAFAGATLECGLSESALEYFSTAQMASCSDSME